MLMFGLLDVCSFTVRASPPASPSRLHLQVKLNVLFPCGTFGYVITELQIIMNANLQLKYKMHIVYEVMRGGRRGHRLS